MKYKNELGEWVTINVRALDSLPVGTELANSTRRI